MTRLNNIQLSNPYASAIDENAKEFMYSSQDSLNAPPASYQEKSLHSKEIDVQKLLGQEALQFDSKDPKPKLLYLQAKADDTNAFPINSPFLSIESLINQMSFESSANEKISSTTKKLIQQARQGDQKSIEYLKPFEMLLNKPDRGVGRLLKSLNENFDLRFKVISTTQEICEEISEVSKINNFKSLIFSAYGMPNAMKISDNELIFQDSENQALYSANYTNINGETVVNNLLSKIDESCFSGLPSDATISLLSGNTGQSPTGIASAISKISQLDVWAPRDIMKLFKTELSSDIPPIPTFRYTGTSVISFLDDHACKFSPDGSSKCGAWKAKLLPAIMDYAPLVIVSLTALYCANIYIKRWIRKRN